MRQRAVSKLQYWRRVGGSSGPAVSSCLRLQLSRVCLVIGPGAGEPIGGPKGLQVPCSPWGRAAGAWAIML